MATTSSGTRRARRPSTSGSWTRRARASSQSRRAPAINGTYRPAALGDENFSAILFHAPGTTPDFVWRNVSGEFGPAAVEAKAIDGSYQPVEVAGTAILYAPGLATDYVYGRPLGGGAVGILASTVINGTYRTGSNGGSIVFHAPGTAPDALWLWDGA